MKIYHCALLTFVFAGCMHEPPGAPRSKYFLDPFAGTDSYSKIFDRKTQEDRAHSEFEPVLVAYCTNWDEEMRGAYVRERAAQYRYQKAEAEKLLQEELTENRKYIVYILSVSTREPSWNDLDRMKSLWRITLENKSGDVQINPDRIEVVSPKDEVSLYFYKKADTFNRTYRVKFLREQWNLQSPGNTEAFVHISGPRGYVGFEQKIESLAASSSLPLAPKMATEEKKDAVSPAQKNPSRGQAP